MKILYLGSFLVASIGVATAADVGKNDWPRFRGPTGDGLSPAKGIPTTWSATQNVLWSADLPKAFKIVPRDITVEKPADLRESGSPSDMQSKAFNPYSSPIVSGGKVFVATGGIRTSEHKLLCFDLANGKLLWETSIPPGPLVEPVLDKELQPRTRGRPNFSHRYGYNCPTPCTDGKQVYVTFGTGIMVAVDFQSKIAWQQLLVQLRDKDVGMQNIDVEKYFPLCISTSPLVYKDVVIQICDNGNFGAEHSSIMAFDCKTGSLKYQVDRTGGTAVSWNTPILVTLQNKTTLMCRNERALQGLDPDNGQVIWYVNGSFDRNISLVYGNGVLYSAGKDRTDMAICVDSESTGDISKNKAWKFQFETGLSCGFSSPVVMNGIMYRYVAGGGRTPKGSTETSPYIGKLYGVEMKTGKQLHVLDMPGFTNWASPVGTADGYIYFATGTKSYVVKTGPKPEIAGVNDLGDYNPAPSPAVADGKLIIRGSAKLWCIGKP